MNGFNSLFENNALASNETRLNQLYEKVSLLLHSDPKIEMQIQTELSRMVLNVLTQSMSSDEGYCFKFNLPLTTVSKLFSALQLTVSEVDEAFTKDWSLPPRAEDARMYHDSYYQILQVILYYGIKEDKKYLTEQSLLIILLKLWNGRRTRFLKYCDKRIMKYVVSQMCTNRHLFAKYDGPFELLKNYFVPTLLSKYGPEIKVSSLKIQRLFSQSWGRIRQLFITNMREDIKTGEKKVQGGILALYIKAKEEGLAISSPVVQSGLDEDEPSFDEFSTTHNRDEIINTTADFITMNPNPRYQQTFINQLNQDTNVSAKVIETILSAMHNHLYHDILHDILSIILSKTNINEKNDICATGFMESIRKSVISSKNNVDAKKLNTLCNILLDKIFPTVLQRDFKKYSNVQQIQLRKVIIYGIVNNLRRNICRGSVVGQ